MGRARVSWRFAAVAAVLAWGAAAAPAWAERDGHVIALGATGASACQQAGGAPEVDARSIEICDEALSEGRLERNQRIVTLLNRGLIHLRLRHGAEALADFDAAIAMDEDNGEAYLNRGAALLLMEQPGPAIAALTEAMALGVAQPYKAYFNRGQAREALGDQRGALEDYSTALEIQPDWGPASAELAAYVRDRQERLANALSDDPLP